MVRSPASDDTSLKKGPWTPEEDDKLIKHIHKHGHRSWSALPKLADLNRCGKSCRLRWTNYLRPDIKRGRFSPEEEQTILNLHAVLGNKWSTIANHLPGRTDNEIKNFWNTHLKKKLIQMGFDPMTHRPRTDIFSTLSQLMSLTNLRELVDMQQQVPMEDQALFNLQADMAKLQFFQSLFQPLSMSSNINPNDLHILNLLNSIKENSNNSNLDLSFLNSHLQDLNSLPSLKTLDSNHNQSAAFPQNPDENHLNQRDNLHSSPIWVPEPLSLTQTMPPSHDPYVGSNLASSSHQELAAADSVAWPDHLLDDSIFPNIAYDQS